MAYVNISEVRTFADAVSACGGRPPISIQHTAHLTRREMSQRHLFVPSYVLGTLWNAASRHFSVEYALKVAQAHINTPNVYGELGEAMNAASTVSECLRTGIALMHIHADDPLWKIICGDDGFRLTRCWSYHNTQPRSEAFAALCEMREWIIVLQRNAMIPIVPKIVELAPALYRALSADEHASIELFFGCPLKIGNAPAIVFNKNMLDAPLSAADPERLSNICSTHISTCGVPLVIPTSYATVDRWMKPPLAAQSKQRTIPKSILKTIGQNHRDMFSHAAYDAATYIETLSPYFLQLDGLTLGLGQTGMMPPFLHHLREMTSRPISLVTAHSDDAGIDHLPGISAEHHACSWENILMTQPPEKKFGFVVCYQVLPWLADGDVEALMRCIFRSLAAKGRFFAALEPFSGVSKRSIDWYRNLAHKIGFVVDDTSVYTVPADDGASTIIGLRLKIS